MSTVFKTKEYHLESNWKSLTGRPANWVEVDYSFDSDDCELSIDDVTFRGLTLGVVDWDVDYREGDPYELPCGNGGKKQCVDIEFKITESIGFWELTYEHVLFRFTKTICTDCCNENN